MFVCAHRNAEVMSTPISDDPFDWFDQWYAEALEKVTPEPNAMVVATASDQGRLSSRVVLLKEWNRQGFVFYTNYQSKKGRDIEATGEAALNFYWRSMYRQIRIEGTAERVAAEVSDAYFATRPRGSKIGAWASAQSEPLDERETLLERAKHYEEKFAGKEIPRPEHWGGYRVVPRRFEFWQAQEDRLHDRWEFLPGDDEGWSRRRLNP